MIFSVKLLNFLKKLVRKTHAKKSWLVSTELEELEITIYFCLRFIPDENTESSESEVNKLEKCQDTHTEKKTKIATQSRWKKRVKEMTFIQM